MSTRPCLHVCHGQPALTVLLFLSLRLSVTRPYSRHYYTFSCTKKDGESGKLLKYAVSQKLWFYWAKWPSCTSIFSMQLLCWIALKLPPGRTTVMHLVARETLPEPNSHGKCWYIPLASSHCSKHGWMSLACLSTTTFCFQDKGTAVIGGLLPGGSWLQSSKHIRIIKRRTVILEADHWALSSHTL